MRITAIVGNVLMLALIAFVLVAEGPPKDAVYIPFNVLLVAVPATTLYVLWRAWPGDAAMGRLRTATGVANIVLLLCEGVAIVDQYPHPKEPGLWLFAAVLIATPVLSAWVLLRAPKPPAIRL